MIDDETSAHDWLETLPEWDDTARERIELLSRLLVEENARQNLVSAASLCEIWRRHMVDSAQLLTFVPRETHERWLDLGTGAGFPGLVIAALRPELAVTMVESRMRRIEWLEGAVAALNLPHAQIIGSRLERVPSAQFGVISARAFAPLPKLLKLSSRFSTAHTVWLLPKGRSAQQELDAVPKAMHVFHVEQSLTDAAAGIIVGHLRAGKGGKA